MICLIVLNFILFIIFVILVYLLTKVKCVSGGGYDTKSHNKDIYMVRHGETDKNKEKKPPTPDTPLNDIGKQQAAQTGKLLANMEPFDCVYVSPFLRTRETAELILKELPYSPDVIFDSKLREIDKGNLDDSDEPDDDFNRILNEFKEKYPTDKLFFKHFDEMEDELLKYYTFEKLSDVSRRLTKFYEELRSTKYKRILLIMHKGSIQISMQILFNLSPGAKREDFKNCSISHISDNGKYKLISSANVDHLS